MFFGFVEKDYRKPHIYLFLSLLAAEMHFLIAAFVLIYGLVIIISAIFIAKLKNWARILFIVLMPGSMIFWLKTVLYGFYYSIIGNFTGSIVIFILLIWKVIIPALCIYYLTRPAVKEQFK